MECCRSNNSIRLAFVVGNRRVVVQNRFSLVVKMTLAETSFTKKHLREELFGKNHGYLYYMNKERKKLR